MLGTAILFGLAVGLGLVLLIIPGIIIALMWWPTYFLVADKKAGVIESFSVAARITQNNWGTAILIVLLGMGINLLGLLAFCIGILFSMPLVWLLSAIAYLMMAGQIPLQPVYGQYVQPTPKW